MHIKIDNVSELPLEKLEALEKHSQIESITILGNFSTTVDCKRYKQILQKLEELTEGINPEWSSTKKFVLIYRRVSSNIFYDHDDTNTPEGSQDCKRNLINGLLFGKCVCAGYAEILRNACLLKGVNAIEIDGLSNNGEPHAWNQVEIDDRKWIEVDSTWDHNNGVKYIGTNREEFWKSHIRSLQIIAAMNSDEHIVSNFDLTGFINKEFGLNMEYSAKQQLEFIDLLDKRDARGLDITAELNDLLRRIEIKKQHDEEFEQEVGYTIEELKKMGITDEQIDDLESKFSTETGTRVDRKSRLFNALSEIEKLKKIHQDHEREFEQECGHTIQELLDFGFMPEEIEKMKGKFNNETDERLDRRKVVEEKIAERQKEKLNDTTSIQITDEQNEKLKEQSKDLHPNILRVIRQELKDGYITFDEAVMLLKYKNGKEPRENIESILQRRKNIIERQRNEEFEQECGYTIEQLKEIGFGIEEIGQMKAKYDTKTGEKIDRKKAVEDAINNRRKEHDKVTLQEIGKGTLETFKENPSEAEKAVSSLEQGIKRMNKENYQEDFQL